MVVMASEEELVKTDRVRICQAILKCADISNPVSRHFFYLSLSSESHPTLIVFILASFQTRPHEVSKHWSTVLLEEWTNQAELESGLRLPVSVVRNVDAALQAKGQLGFLDLFVYPLFSASATVMPRECFRRDFSLFSFPSSELQLTRSPPSSPSLLRTFRLRQLLLRQPSHLGRPTSSAHLGSHSSLPPHPSLLSNNLHLLPHHPLHPLRAQLRLPIPLPSNPTSVASRWSIGLVLGSRRRLRFVGRSIEHDQLDGSSDGRRRRSWEKNDAGWEERRSGVWVELAEEEGDGGVE